MNVDGDPDLFELLLNVDSWRRPEEEAAPIDMSTLDLHERENDLHQRSLLHLESGGSRVRDYMTIILE